mgnify:CR=1 FL=1
MPTFRQGDVVRVPFPYTDRDTQQHRPVFVVSAGGLGRNEFLLWGLMITSTVSRAWPGDVLIDDLELAGLPVPSIVRTLKVATIEAEHASRLGEASDRVRDMVLAAVRKNLAL